jgi:alpha-glucosidase
MQLYFRGGSIIPQHYATSGKTSVDFKKSGLTLLIALDLRGQAEGELFLDDGHSFMSGKTWATMSAKLVDESNSVELNVEGDFGYVPASKAEIVVKEVLVWKTDSQKHVLATNFVLDGKKFLTWRL